MSVTGGANLTFGSFAMVPGSNVVDFNAGMQDLGYGWVDDDTATGFTASKLWVFDVATTLVFCPTSWNESR